MHIINRAIIKINKIKILKLTFLFIFTINFFYHCFKYFFSFLYATRFPSIVDEHNNIILSNLGFNFGAILNNLQIGEGLKANYFNIDFYVSRMPLLNYNNIYI